MAKKPTKKFKPKPKLGRPFSRWPVKFCRNCGKRLERKFFPGCGKWETPTQLKARSCCDEVCGGAYRLKMRRGGEVEIVRKGGAK